MIDPLILSHFEKKKAWMESHITQAQFPTQISQQGLAYYQAQESIPQPIAVLPAPSSYSQNFYLVDCHPLMVRYARTIAENWLETERDAILEFFSQISLTDMPLPENIEIRLYIGMLDAAPHSVAMCVRTVETKMEAQKYIVGCYDIFAKTDDLKKELLTYLAQQHRSDLFVVDHAPN